MSNSLKSILFKNFISDPNQGVSDVVERSQGRWPSKRYPGPRGPGNSHWRASFLGLEHLSSFENWKKYRIQVHKGNMDRYRNSLRSRVFNLRDKKNQALRENVLTGVVSPDKFAVSLVFSGVTVALQYLRFVRWWPPRKWRRTRCASSVKNSRRSRFATLKWLFSKVFSFTIYYGKKWKAVFY